jgi:flagellar biosynthesis protein FlhF
VRPKNFPREGALSPGFEEVRQRLLSTGCSEEWSARICERASDAADVGDHPMDTIGSTIADEVRIASLPKAPGVTRVITFVGNTGVGKTTGLVKLGARLVKARRKIGLATLDSRRVGAVEQYRAYAELLGAPLRTLNSDEILTPEALGTIGNDVVLLDTTGRPAVDQPRLVQFNEAMKKSDRSTRMDAFLVFPATASRESLLEVSEAYGDIPMAGCVITKLDETRKPSPVLEHVVDMGLPIAFMSNGQDIGRHFQRATPELLADLVLLGRI